MQRLYAIRLCVGVSNPLTVPSYRTPCDCQSRNRVYTLGMETLSTTDVAKLLGLQSRTICQYVRRGLIQPRKRAIERPGACYAFCRSEIERFSQARRRRGKPAKSRQK